MRKLSIVVCLLCLFVTVPALADPMVGNGPGYDGGQVHWDRVSDYYQGRGGEFTIYSDTSWGSRGLLLSNSAYDLDTKGQDGNLESFQTFCLEAGEFVNQPMNIWVSESSTTISYVYGSGSHAWWGGVAGVGDDLDYETAWLYTQFATGNLFGYDFDSSGGYASLTRAQTGSALQRLIWNIEGEDGGIGVASGSSFMDVTLTGDQAKLIGEWQTLFDRSGWSGIGNVRVLQMKTTCDGRAQDQLFLVPVPGAILLGMIGLSAAGLKLRRFA